MAVTYYVALPFIRTEDGTAPGEAQEYRRANVRRDGLAGVGQGGVQERRRYSIWNKVAQSIVAVRWRLPSILTAALKS
jgi:hypothetical protein